MSWTPDITYIDILNSMENIYDSMAENYRNRDDLLKEYLEEQNFEWPE